MHLPSSPVDIIVATNKTANVATATDRIYIQPFSTSFADDMYHGVVFSKADILAPRVCNPVFVKSTVSGKRIIEPINDRLNRLPLHVAREEVDVTSIESFHISLENLSNKQVHISKRIVVAHVANSFALLITTEAALLDADLEIEESLHCKPLVGRDTQMTCNGDVDAKKYHNFKHNQKSEIQLSNNYTKYCD